MKAKNRILVCMFFISLFGSSFMISNVTAEDDWGFEEADTMLYFLNVKVNETTKAQGYVSYLVDDIDSVAETITLTIETDFKKGEDMITYRDNIERDDVTYTTDFIFIELSPGYTLAVFYEINYYENVPTNWQMSMDGLEINYENLGYTVETSVGELSYEFHATKPDGEDLYFARSFNENGIMTKFDYKWEKPDGYVLIRQFEKCFLPLKLPIALPNLYVYIGLGVIGVLVIGVILLTCRKKKK